MTAIFNVLNSQENNNTRNTVDEVCTDGKVDKVANYKQIITQDVRRALAQAHVAKQDMTQTVNEVKNNTKPYANRNNQTVQ